MRLRRAVVAVHRDLGYLAAGLTLVYAVSGVAVNHIADWNPSFTVRTVRHQVDGLPREGSAAAVVGFALERLGETDEPTAVVALAPGVVRAFFEGRTVTVFASEGLVTEEVTRRRPVFHALNFIHLNHGKGLWTWLADLYAVALAVLAATGIFIVPGRKGLGGRGRWLLAAGIAIPLVYLAVAL